VLGEAGGHSAIMEHLEPRFRDRRFGSKGKWSPSAAELTW